MDSTVLREVQLQVRKMYTILNEVMDLSRQMAQMADRGDEVSLQMLTDMRSEPLERLRSIRGILMEYRQRLPRPEGDRLAALLNGEKAQVPEEAELAAQVDQMHRMLENVLSVDRRLSLKLAGDGSFYKE